MITIVDARMGRGKTSAAIRYMNENKHEKRFLYVTPYLSEVKRIRDECGFEEPETNEESSSKLAQLKALLHRKKNIATTHAMFTDFMDDEAFELVEDGEYTLILDESIRGIETVPINEEDLEHMIEKYVEIDEKHNVKWVNSRDYNGSLVGYKKMADDGGLFCADGWMFHISGVANLLRFSDVYVLTYLFSGQSMRACLDYFNYPYRIIGVKTDSRGFMFSDEPDMPPPVDYKTLIHIVGDNSDDPKEKKMNLVGDNRTALSVSWYKREGKSSANLKKIRGAMQKLARKFGTNDMIWTIYKNNVKWITDSGNRYLRRFVSLSARATNDYRNATIVAYLANRFIDTNIARFLSEHGVHMSQDDFALSEMLQFIWRSAIRDGKPITVYMPSKRMRDLLNKWIDEQATITETSGL